MVSVCLAAGMLPLILPVAGCQVADDGANGNDGGSGNGNDNGMSDDPCDVPGAICTVAGTGESLFNGDGLPAKETALYFPLDVEFDSEGRALLLDWNNIRVRRINDDGVVETVMGTDFEGVPANGAPAVETPLHHPSDIEFDAEYRLYVAGDHVPFVFRVERDQTVTIVAGFGDYGFEGDGGPAVDAELGTPFGVLPDNLGGFYYADLDGHVIRYTDSEGIITKIAGTGTRGYAGDGGPAVDAELNGPSRMRLLGDGSLLFCDTDNNVVRRIDPSGTIHAYAGTGDAGYAGDGGPAVDALFTRPYDVKIGPDGAVYIADTGNNVIRRVADDGTVATIIGTGEKAYAGDGEDAASCSMSGPSSITFDGNGDLWISDTFNQRVRRVRDVMTIVDRLD